MVVGAGRDHGQVILKDYLPHMLNKLLTPQTRWRLTPLEIIAVVATVLVTITGIVFSVQDALRLESAINLDLTQTLIVTQGIVNLQREVQLTRNEVTRLLGGLDDPPKPISRFDFIEIQVKNLASELQSPTIQYIFSSEDVALVQEIETRSARIKQLISDWQSAGSPALQTSALKALDVQLAELETIIKKLVDRQATTQRDAIVQTRDTLSVSQRTSLLGGTVLLLMGIALAVLFRWTSMVRVHQAVEADRLKSQLLTSVSHELRTPLTAIQGYAQLLHEGTFDKLTEKQQATMRRILLNTAQLRGMVNNLLDRAQIEQGKISLRNAPFAPADLIDTVHSALNILAESKGLKLTSEIAPEVPAMLTGDVLRLQQILFNLTGNALKFTEKGSVQARISLPDAAHWSLQVTDTGIGIPLEAQAQIFAPFWQVDSSATRQYRGSGLGLFIIKELAELMGGVITVASQPGEGSTFTITFPLEVKA
jgi:signal transduction histidine kinase